MVWNYDGIVSGNVDLPKDKEETDRFKKLAGEVEAASVYETLGLSDGICSL